MLSSPSYKTSVFLDFRIWFWKGMYCAGTKHLIRMTDWPFMRPNVWRCLASEKLLLEYPQLFTTPGTSFKCSSTEHLVLPSRPMTKIAGSLGSDCFFNLITDLCLLSKTSNQSLFKRKSWKQCRETQRNLL